VLVILTRKQQQDVYPVADMEGGNAAALNTGQQYYDIQDGNMADEGSIESNLLNQILLSEI
jgi:hypothetical protein